MRITAVTTLYLNINKAAMKKGLHNAAPFFIGGSPAGLSPAAPPASQLHLVKLADLHKLTPLTDDRLS